MKTSKPRLAILISGQGSNLQAIIDAIENEQLTAEIVVVLSSNPAAYGLERAKKNNLETQIVPRANYANKETYSLAVQQILENYKPDLVVLAGFLQVLSHSFVNHFQGNLINIHPSLLPKYKGLHTHQQVLEAGDKIHGVTVHYVSVELDAGPIIEQATLEVLPTDTVASLETKIHQLEHVLYPKVIANLLKIKKISH